MSPNWEGRAMGGMNTSIPFVMHVLVNSNSQSLLQVASVSLVPEVWESASGGSYS